MSFEAVTTKEAPAAIGPYSQAIDAGDTVFCSGQLGLDPATGNLREGLEAQTRQSLANLGAVLKSVGLGTERIVKTTIFLVDMADFAKVNEIYGSFLGSHRPARSTVAVAALPKGGLVEIEAIARR
ncbi:MAG TPA: RidA family protein [Rectinemataceae bacterium]|nr:RidA family protein [Rectinemataceae bacterium]